MPFLPPNQQRQSTEGKNINTHTRIVVQNEKKKKERGGRICGCVKCGGSIRLVTVFVVACEVARWRLRDRRDSTLSHTLSETRSVTAIFHYTDPTRPDQTRQSPRTCRRPGSGRVRSGRSRVVEFSYYRASTDVEYGTMASRPISRHSTRIGQFISKKVYRSR